MASEPFFDIVRWHHYSPQMGCQGSTLGVALEWGRGFLRRKVSVWWGMFLAY